MQRVQSSAARSALGRTTRSMWLRCLECTREFHRLQRVVSLETAVYLHILLNSLLRERRREANRYTTPPIRPKIAISRDILTLQLSRLDASGVEEAR